MAYVIPSDGHVAGDTGHIADHNDIADVMTVHQSYHANPLTSGESILPRLVSQNEISLTTQQLVLTYWTAVTSGTATTVSTFSGGTAASAMTYAAVGIYSVNTSTGDLTKVSDTGDVHASIWTGTFNTYTKTLSPSFTRVAGTRYAMGVLAVGSGLPTVQGMVLPGTCNLAPFMSAAIGSQATLPSSVSGATAAADFWFQVFFGAVAP